MSENKSIKEKSKVIAGLLGIFLGTFGVHNFYIGSNGKAIAQLLITLLSFGTLFFVSAIWGFIEGVLILCNVIKINNKETKNNTTETHIKDTETDLADVDGDKCNIICQVSKFGVAVNNKWNVLLDNKFVGNIDFKNNLQIKVSKGQHTIQYKIGVQKTKILTFNASNEDIIIECIFDGTVNDFHIVGENINNNSSINMSNKDESIEENIEVNEITDKLKDYKKLLDDGVITQEEFDTKKKQLLKFLVKS